MTQRPDGKSRLDQLDFAAESFRSSRPDQEPESNGQTSSPSAQKSRQRLNPIFVEWLMDWPLHWTDIDSSDCGPQEMELWLSRQRSHLSDLVGGS